MPGSKYLLLLFCTGALLNSCNDPEPGTRQPVVFRYAISHEPPTTDPQLNYAGVGELIASNLHTGLVGTDDRMQPVPGVADSWEVSDDGLVYRFSLREDAMWSDGTPLGASDFLRSWQRLLDPATGSKHVSLAFPIHNAREVHSGRIPVEELGVTVINEGTIEVILNSPTPYMLQNFAHGAFMPVPMDRVSSDPETWAGSPETHLGNGPFILKSFNPETGFILQRNPYYHSRELVKLDEIHLPIIPDARDALDAYETGEIDALTYMPTKDIPRLAAETGDVHISPRVRSVHIYPRLTVPHLNDSRVREALSRSLDRTTLSETLGLGLIPATGYVPVGLYVGSEDYREIAGDLNLSTKANLPLARQLMASAGYPDGTGFPSLTLITSTTYLSAAEYCAVEWKRHLGIDIEVEILEGQEVSRRRVAGDFDLAIGGWSAQVFHPSYFLEQLDSSAASNYPAYSNPEYDELIARAAIQTESSANIHFLRLAEEVAIARDFAIIPLYYETSRILIRDSVTGWYSDPIGRFHFSQAYVMDSP